jgi:hypothetical protein
LNSRNANIAVERASSGYSLSSQPVVSITRCNKPLWTNSRDEAAGRRLESKFIDKDRDPSLHAAKTLSRAMSFGQKQRVMARMWNFSPRGSLLPINGYDIAN